SAGGRNTSGSRAGLAGSSRPRLTAWGAPCCACGHRSIVYRRSVYRRSAVAATADSAGTAPDWPVPGVAAKPRAADHQSRVVPTPVAVRLAPSPVAVRLALVIAVGAHPALTVVAVRLAAPEHSPGSPAVTA